MGHRLTNHLVWRDRVHQRINKVHQENEIRQQQADEKEKARLMRDSETRESSASLTHASATEPVRYQWKIGDVFTNGSSRWAVDSIDGDTAVLRSCATRWATTMPLTFDEWREDGRWQLDGNQLVEAATEKERE